MIFVSSALADPSGNSADRQSIKQIHKYIAAIQANEVVVEKQEIPKLLAIAGNYNVGATQRVIAYVNALSVATTSKSRSHIVEFLYTQPPMASTDDRIANKLGDRFVADYLRHGKLYEGLSTNDQEKIVRVIARCWNRHGLKQRAVKAVALAPPRVRKMGILELARINHTDLPESLKPYIDEELRLQLVSQAVSDIEAGRVYASGIGYLTGIGNESIVSSLQQRQVGESDQKKKQKLEELIWRVEVQETPQKMLEYLRIVPNDWNTANRQVFVLEKAVKKGIPKENIHSAIRAQWEQADMSDHFEGGGLRQLKKEAMRVGVMTKADLPNVVVRDEANRETHTHPH